MFKTIRWRFVIIYFTLVFIAMIISGIFIVNAFENYYFSDIEDQLDDVYQVIAGQFQDREDMDKARAQEILASYKDIGFGEEMFLLSMRNEVLATTTNQTITEPSRFLAARLLLLGLNPEGGSGVDINEEDLLFDKVYPLLVNDEKIGSLYLRYDLTSVYKALDKNRGIIVQGTAIASVITVFLGYFIARSITVPINDVTEKASKMAKGDFDQYVEVKSSDEIGKLAEMFNYLTNRLKESMSELHRESSKIEAIVNHMEDGLIAVDLTGRIIHVNQKVLHQFGLRTLPEDQQFRDVFSGLEEKLQLEEIMEKKDWSGRTDLRYEGSTYRVKYAPFENDLSQKMGIVFILQDITEEHRLEEMRREFVANVSHELKTPLTTIKSYTETILDGVVNDHETMLDFLGVINNESDRMTRLVRDLLQLSNFDSRKIAFDFEYHDYLPLIKKSIDKLKVMYEQKHQTVTMIAEAKSIVGYFDHDRLEQVLVNIISNASKYSPDHTEIQVLCMVVDKDVIIKVKDQGVGIPELDLNRIFERFYRVDKARSREMGGTGLGLSIAKEIVDGHEGKIELRSQVNVGTTVTITIPLNMIEM